MTREEAWQGLQGFSLFIADGTDLKEALNMAIEALSADTVATIQTGQTYGKSVYIKELAEVVRCKDCRHANECQKSVQYTRCEPNTVTIGYSPIEWCSHGERKEDE